MRLGWAASSLACLAAAACGSPHGGRGSLPGGLKPGDLNLVVVTLDTTRSDRLGCYGSKDVKTPSLDSLAARGVLFENAISPMPLTLPAHSSLFTGRLPAAHGVRDNGGFTLGPDQVTLAETLRDAGWATGGFVSAYVLDHKWGISQGFDRYFDDFDLTQFKSVSMGEIQRRGDVTLQQAAGWIGEHAGGRFFAWLHLYDPHAPYDPPEPFKSAYPGRPYNGEIAWTDELVGRLVKELERLGVADRTVIAVIGDHGESLGEHGENGHGFFIYTQTTHVPFLLASPYGGLQGRNVAEVVHNVDLMPTLLDLLGVAPVAPPSGPVQGRSLLPLLEGRSEGVEAEGLVDGGWSESWYPRFHYGWSELRAVRSGRWHFIEAPRPELYDLDADPGETDNRAAAEPGTVEEMRGLLEGVEAATGQAAESPAPIEEDEETLRKLASLGYVGSLSPETAKPGVSWKDLPDPKDKIAVYNLINRAKEEASDGDADKAIAMLNDVLAQDPEVVDGWFLLGNAYFKKQDWARAAEYFTKTLEKRPDHDYAVIGLADTLVARGRVDDALVGYRKFLETDPRNAQITYRMAEVLLDSGREAEAAEAFARTLEIEPKAARAEVGRGVVAFREKDFAGARAAIARALAIDPKARNARYNLALIEEAEGRPAGALAQYRAEIADYPTAYKALFNMGRLLGKTGDRAGSIAALRGAVEANPDFSIGRFFLAQALLGAGDLDGAAGEARQGLERDPDSEYAPLGHYVLADVLDRQGRRAEALVELRRGRQLESAPRKPSHS
jgi:arylsulfatase A-like enzyme/Tfp pilus assembly protein PilF